MLGQFPFCFYLQRVFKNALEAYLFLLILSLWRNIADGTGGLRPTVGHLEARESKGCEFSIENACFYVYALFSC